MNNASQIEIIISGFANEGNNELELDNIEIVANMVADTGGLLGDVNMDGFANFFDIAPFIARLSNPEFLFEADINGDGMVNFFDIQPFIDILSDG